MKVSELQDSTRLKSVNTQDTCLESGACFLHDFIICVSKVKGVQMQIKWRIWFERPFFFLKKMV